MGNVENGEEREISDREVKDLVREAMAPAIHFTAGYYSALYFKDTIAEDGSWVGERPLFYPVNLPFDESAYQILCAHGVAGKPQPRTATDEVSIYEAIPDCDECKTLAIAAVQLGIRESAEAEDGDDAKALPRWVVYAGAAGGILAPFIALAAWLLPMT